MNLRLTGPLLLASLASLTASTATAQTPPRLWVMGPQVSFGKSVTITLASDAVGSPALLALGLTPLPLESPIVTGKGPLYFGQLLMTLPFGVVPGTQRIDVPVALPPFAPVLDGVHVVLQGYVAGALSNPATVPMVQPYFEAANAQFITSPVPQQTNLFGDRVAVGDLNGDGHDDLVVGAWFETVAGQLAAGRAYVLWGPDFSGFVQLTTPAPAFAANFGSSILAGDLDHDGVDDLVVTQNTGSPYAGKHGYIYIYYGGPVFPAAPSLVIESPGTGIEYVMYGRSGALGDLNADGYLDIVVNVDHATLGSMINAGRVDVHFGPGFTEYQSVYSALPGTNDYFGSTIEVGDVNGDGFTDLIEGSGRTDVGGEVNIGRVEVFFGPSVQPSMLIACPLPDGFNTRFGGEINAVDLEGDGINEIFANDDRDHGYVFRTSKLDDYILVTRPTDSSEPPPPAETWSDGPTTSGDVNGDSILDLVLEENLSGPATGCGLSSKGGWVYIAHGPYYATFDRFSDAAPVCGESFGDFNLFISQAGELEGCLIITDSFDKTPGIPGAGKVTLFR